MSSVDIVAACIGVVISELGIAITSMFYPLTERKVYYRDNSVDVARFLFGISC